MAEEAQAEDGVIRSQAGGASYVLEGSASEGGMAFMSQCPTANPALPPGSKGGLMPWTSAPLGRTPYPNRERDHYPQLYSECLTQGTKLVLWRKSKREDTLQNETY